METREVFDAYFEDKPHDMAKKVRRQVDRQEVYDHEKKLGKQIFEMDSAELTEMLRSFKSYTKGSNEYSVSYASVLHIKWLYKEIWDYYIDNVKVIKNPWNSKAMKGMELAKKLMGTRKVFTKESLLELIKKVHAEYETDRAEYLECLMLLYYDGIKNPEELISIKAGMVDTRKRLIKLPDREVKLQKRTMELLKAVHNLDHVSRGGYGSGQPVTDYDGSYFKFIVKKKDGGFSSNDLELAARNLRYRLSQDVGKLFGLKINHSLLYYLGFYDRAAAEVGEDELRGMVLTQKDSEKSAGLIELADAYGITYDSVSALRGKLLPYIELDK